MLQLGYTNELASDTQDLRLLIYGPPRSGKTQFAGTFPAPLVVAPSLCKNELLTLADEEIPIAWFNTAAEAVNVCKDLKKDIANKFKTTGGFRTIIVDNLTVACQMWLEEFETGTVRNPQRDIWGALSETILGIYRILHSLSGVHIVWICHDVMKTFTTGTGRDKETSAIGDFSVPGNAFRDVVSKTCIIAHTEHIQTSTKRIYRVWFKKHGIWNAGGWFPESRKLARQLEFIGPPKYSRVHYDVLAEALGLRNRQDEETRLFGGK